MKSKIPLTIHYCWFGGNTLPPLAKKCIESWKKYLPDYEIKRWDETNYNVHKIQYISDAYLAKKYAFVSDYARFDILYQEGGLYFDTDVEVIKSFDDIIKDGPFMGCENSYIPDSSPSALGVAPGLGLGVNPGLGLYKEILEIYENLKFDPNHLTTVVTYITDYLCSKGLKNSPDVQEVEGIKIYPKDYFCPIDYKSGILQITDNTRSIHHYAESWHGSKEKLYKCVENLLGEHVAKFISKVWRTFNR